MSAQVKYQGVAKIPRKYACTVIVIAQPPELLLKFLSAILKVMSIEIFFLKVLPEKMS